jgi:hypothetical protein
MQLKKKSPKERLLKKLADVERGKFKMAPVDIQELKDKIKNMK